MPSAPRTTTTAAHALRSSLPLSLEGLLERMNRQGVVEVVVPLPLDELLACGTPTALERELSRRIAGDPTLLQLVEWEPIDVEFGAVLLLVRAIAPEDTLRARLAAAEEDHDGTSHDAPDADA